MVRSTRCTSKATAETSIKEDYTETVVNCRASLYKCDNVTLDYQLVPLDVNSPLDMRAPGGVTGVSVLEVAMDELAYEVGMDPVDFRVKNFTDWDQNANLPFSSKALREVTGRVPNASVGKREPPNHVPCAMVMC